MTESFELETLHTFPYNCNSFNLTVTDECPPSQRAKRLTESPGPESGRGILQTRIPSEVVQRIFAWVHPCAAPKYTRLCKHVCTSLKARHFLRLNLQKFRVEADIETYAGRRAAEKTSGMPWDGYRFERVAPWKTIRDNSRSLLSKMTYYELESCLSNLSPNQFAHWVGLDSPDVSSQSFLNYFGKLLHEPVLYTHRIYKNCCGCRGFGCVECLNPFERVWIAWPDWCHRMYISVVAIEHLETYNNMSAMRLRWIPAPSELHLLRNLKSFCLRGNYARVHAKDETYSSIPHQFGYLQKLRDLDLGCNNLTGPIPFELFNLKLTLLNLERNKLTGTLPDAISCLSNLKFLNLSFNEMSGKLTPKIGSLTQLFLLDLHRNYFEGDIPIEIGKCISLQKLDLGANKFTGAIPPTLSNLSQLRVLSLTRNSLTGAVPPDLSLLTHLDVLALGGNFLNPIIPIELERLTKLREIHLWWENSSEIEMLQSLAPDSRLRRLLLESAADVEPVGACGGGISVEDTAAESDNESGMYESEEDCDYQPNW